MSADTRIRIALGVALVLVVGLVIFGAVATRSVEENSEPLPKAAKSGSSVEKGMSKDEAEIKDTEEKIKKSEQKVKDTERETEAGT